MAKALYSAAHPDDDVASAGTIVDAPGQSLKAASANNTIAVMQELGIDVSKYTRQQLTEQMLDDFDKIVYMSEPENTPEWLRVHPKAMYWEISDTKWMATDGVREMRDAIKQRIADM